MALPSTAGPTEGAFFWLLEHSMLPFPQGLHLGSSLCQKRDPHSGWPAPAPACCPRAVLLSGLPKLFQLRQPTPVWSDTLLSLARQGLASFPTSSPGQTTLAPHSESTALGHCSRAGRASQCPGRIRRVEPSEEGWRRVTAENSTIKKCFVVTADAKFGDGPTLPPLIPVVLVACLSSSYSTNISWLVHCKHRAHMPCPLISLCLGLPCTLPRNLVPFV